ncbi:MAG: lytic transglycosylase domain-containing protein [bacterium]
MMRRLILLLLLFLSINITAANDIDYLDSLLSSDRPHIYIKHIEDINIKNTALVYTIDHYIENEKYNELLEMDINEHGFKHLSGRTKMIDDMDVLRNLDERGYEIINRAFIQKHGDIEENLKFRDKYTDSLLLSQYSSLPQSTIIKYIALRNDKSFNTRLIEEKNNIYAQAMNLMIDNADIPDTLKGEVLELMVHIKDRTILLNTSHIIPDTVSNKRMQYYRGRYYESEGDFRKAMKFYLSMSDSEAYIRMIAEIGNAEGRSVSDSILLADTADMIPVRYHKAKACYFNRMPLKGDSILRYLAGRHSIDYYSTRARQLLNSEINVDDIEVPDNTEYISQIFSVFKDHSEDDCFLEYINSLYNQEGNAMAISAILNHLEIYNVSILYAYNLLYSGEDLSKIYRLMFPLPHKEIFTKASQENKMDLALVYAMARHESWFDQYAQSPVGAKGIMQLMDFVYESFYDDNDYFNLEKNIYAGTAHIRKYLDYFPDNYAYGIMAYNAGPGNVEKWKRSNIDWELYLEMIPFRETRIFVKRILRNYYYYRMLLKES